MTSPAQTYSTFIEQELIAERTRMATLDGRSATVAAASVVLGALVGLGGAFGPDGGHSHDVAATVLLLTAVGAFASAATLAALSGRRRHYEVIPSSTLDDMTSDDHWDDPEDHARRAVTFVKMNSIRATRISNKRRERLLTAALVAQLAALAAVAAHAAVRVLA